MMRPSLALAILCLAWFLAVAAARAEDEDVLQPTPARTPGDVARTMRRHGIPECELDEAARAPEKRSVVGALTGLGGGRTGFMPLLQHHMAVEHWFLEGLSRDMLDRWPGKRERIFVRLEGAVSLERQWSPFGGEGGTGFYGNGLPHGKVYGDSTGGVMGYHESVFRFAVTSVTWAKTREAFAALAREFKRRKQATAEAIEKGDWAEALASHLQAREMHSDLGIHDATDLEPGLRALALLAGDASAWTDEDVETIARPFRLGFPSKLKKKVVPAMKATTPAWPTAAKERLSVRLVEVFEDLEYAFQKKELRKGALAILGGPAVVALEERIAEVEAEIVAYGERLTAHLEAYEYAKAKAVWDEMAPARTFLRPYAYSEQKARKWLPSLERVLALEAAWPDPAKRAALLETQIRDAIASGSDLPNTSYRPRYPRELVEHFFPRLTPAERRRVEKLLLELAEELDPDEDWDGSLVAAEMLTGVASKAASNFMPRFLAARRDRPSWQRKRLEAFAEAIREQARR